MDGSTGERKLLMEDYRLTASDSGLTPSAIAETLREHGVVIVENVLGEHEVEQLLAASSKGFSTPSNCASGVTETVRSLPALFSVAPVFSEVLLLNPLFLGVADEILNRHCYNYRVQVASGAQIVAGGENQALHREMDIYRPFLPFDPVQAEYLLFSMWAATPFTAANGATRFVPGSHRWEETRLPSEEEVIQAEMPAGSMALWLGTTLHGGGVNTTEKPRTGFICALGVDWLVQEENQYLAVPEDVAKALPPKTQQLLGYRASPTYGWVRGRSGDNLLQPSGGMDGYVIAGLGVSEWGETLAPLWSEQALSSDTEDN